MPGRDSRVTPAALSRRSRLAGILGLVALAATAPAAFAEADSVRESPRFHEPSDPPVLRTLAGDEVVELVAVQDIDGRNYELTYNQDFPGPTIHASPGETLWIDVINHLQPLTEEELENFRPPVLQSGERPEVKQLLIKKSAITNLHTHGLHVSPQGRADNVLLKINPGKQNRYEYELPEDHAPGTHWYHSHLHGSTALQVQGGMTGVLIVNPPDGLSLNPPGFSVDEEIVVLHLGAGGDLSAKSLPEDVEPALRSFQNSSGSAEELDESLSEEEILALLDALGDEPPQMLVEALREQLPDPPIFEVNGDLNPVLHLSPGRIERLRLVNAGSRNLDYKQVWVEGHDIYLAAFDGINLTELPKDKDGQYVRYYCDEADSDKCVKGNTLALAPGNRADVYFVPKTAGDYDLMMAGETRSSSPLASKFSQELMTFHVSNPDFSTSAAFAPGEYESQLRGFLDALDEHLRKLQKTPPYEGYLRPLKAAPSIQRTVRFDIGPGSGVSAPPPQGSNQGKTFTINERDYNRMVGGAMGGATDYLGKKAGDGGKPPAGVDRDYWPMRTGTEEEWTIVNKSGRHHPFHIHVNPFWVVDICEKNGNDKQCTSVDKGDPRLNRWQDTINVPEHGSVTVRHRISDFDGLLVLHCHILQHEDRGMMINVLIVPNKEKDAQAYFERQLEENARINREIDG